MLNYLFERRPEYDKNGKVVSYTVPKIIWVTVFAVLFLCCKDKVINIMKSNSGGKR